MERKGVTAATVREVGGGTRGSVPFVLSTDQRVQGASWGLFRPWSMLPLSLCSCSYSNLPNSFLMNSFYYLISQSPFLLFIIRTSTHLEL